MWPTDVSGWVGLVGGFIGLLAIVAATVAYLRVGLAQTTIKSLKESNDAYRERNEQLDGTIAELRKDQLALRTTVEALERENATLRELVSGKADVQRLFEMIRDHHDQMMTQSTDFQAMWVAGQTEVNQRLESNRAAINDLLALVGNGRERAGG